MPTIHTHRSTNVKTIALGATLLAGAAALAALAMSDPPVDAEMPIVSFDVAPPVAISPSEAAPPAATTLLSAVSGGSRQVVAKPVPSRVGQTSPANGSND